MINSQSQKGGDASTNIQAQQMVVHIGIDERRAREIYQEMNLQLRKDYSQEALNLASSRIVEFENRLMPKMAQVEGALEAFADPSFQLLLIEAQKAAASTERPADYDLLSELLVHRFQKGTNRVARAGISLAVEIVDKVSDEALLGLTVSHAVVTFTPLSGDINQGLDALNDLFEKILYRKLPEGHDWLDHLDILKAVRLSPLVSLKKTAQYYPEVLAGYVDVGIAKNSEDHRKAIELLAHNNIPTDMLVEHALNNDFCRLNIPNTRSIDQLSLIHQTNLAGVTTKSHRNFSNEQKQAVRSIYELYANDGSTRSRNINSFMSEWNKRPSLAALREWWDAISVSFTITSVGKILAHSNAQRCDNSLPALD